MVRDNWRTVGPPGALSASAVESGTLRTAGALSDSVSVGPAGALSDSVTVGPAGALSDSGIIGPAGALSASTGESVTDGEPGALRHRTHEAADQVSKELLSHCDWLI